MTIERNSLLIAMVFGSLALLKIGFLAHYGPITFPDTETYTLFADRMAENLAWLHDAEMEDDVRPATTFRMIGYPALIYASKSLMGSAWDYGLVSLQILLSLVASGFLYRLARDLGASAWVGLFIVFAHTTGQSFLYDQALLTDSLNASFTLIAVAIMCRGFVSHAHPDPWHGLAIGLLLSAALLMREANFYLQVFFWPLAAMWLWRFGRAGIGRAVIVALAVALPFVGVFQGYKAWNEYRTGLSFLTSGGQTALMTPLVRIASTGIDVFDGDSTLDRVARDNLKSYAWREINTINGAMKTQYNMTGPQIAGQIETKYLQTWAKYPRAMIAYSISGFNFKQVTVQFWPTRYLNRVVLFTTNESPIPTRKDLIKNIKAGEFNPLAALGVLVENLVRIPAAMIFIAFVVVTPVRAFRHLRNRQAWEPSFQVASGLWVIYWGLVVFYSLLDIELRYVLPVTPFATVLGVIHLNEWFVRFRNRKRPN